MPPATARRGRHHELRSAGSLGAADPRFEREGELAETEHPAGAGLGPGIELAAQPGGAVLGHVAGVEVPDHGEPGGEPRRVGLVDVGRAQLLRPAEAVAVS